MTVFVVSLFLPNTINFNIPTPTHSQSSRKSSLNHQNGALLSGAAEPTPPGTPNGTHLFPREKAPTLTIPDLLPLGALNDPHSPAWGSGRSFNQPPSRAGQLPPSSILKHVKALERLSLQSDPVAGTQAPTSDHPHEQSRDRYFADAEWTVEKAEQGNGGLRNAVNAARETKDLEVTWVGTLGMPTDVLSDQQKVAIADRLETEHDSLTVYCKDSDFNGHYTHYCKQILWPVFHYQIPDNPKSKAYEDHSWEFFATVNQAFADKIIKKYKRGDIIWVNDYHLFLVPSLVRKKLPDAQIGFFLHVAFPSSEVFRCLAMRKQLLEGILASNLIGFQTEEYCKHFLQTCNRLLNVEATNDGVQLDERFVKVLSFAIGIDPASLDSARETPSVEHWLKLLRERYEGKKVIVARDKLDSIRGVRQKLLSFEIFLKKYPEWQDKTVLLQVATSTTEQAELDATVSDIVTRINSAHATLAHQPVNYLKQDIPFNQYIALLTIADALMVTSLREGMNLTSHEFIFCQDGKLSKNKHGVLILSEFTGSASVFDGSQLTINPWDYQQCADAIKIALEMSDEEKEIRWKRLYASVMHHNSTHWLSEFLESLEKAWKEQSAHDTISIPRLSLNTLGAEYKKANRRLFILDYEGTLASWGSPSNIILTSPQRVLDVLNDVLLDEKNIVYVMSARMPEELDGLFDRVPNLGMIAENGCFLKEFGESEWTTMINLDRVKTWKESVIGILNYYMERSPGSRVEERHCSLIYNYAGCEDLAAAARQAGDCANHINDACEDQRVHAIPIDDSLSVEPIDWNKGTAATRIFDNLREKHEKVLHEEPVDFLMVVGNDREDEPIFRWANKLGEDGVIKKVTTVSVGSRNTEAMSTLTQGVTGK
ncbi:MAG: hypothetical protein M1829_000693 [Trizodia sp. TS-e1964]|nr:MAG: hypothetical protein M1829_000693 [Trizodia sp. TS-e1964]